MRNASTNLLSVKNLRISASRFATPFVITVFAAIALGHDYWLDPRPAAKKGAAVELAAFVGMEFRALDRKLLTPGKLILLKAFDAEGPRDLLESMAVDVDVRSVRARVEGPLVVALQSRRTFLELTADKFHEYLVEEGLDSIVEMRKSLGESGEPGRELYQRSATTLLRVEDPDTRKKAGPELFIKPVGLPIEIVPSSDPTSLRAGSTLTVAVLYQKAPLAGATVRVMRRETGAASRPATMRLKTDSEGKVNIPVEGGGEWLAATVHMTRLQPGADPDHPDAQWESFWGSLTWVVPPGAESRPVKEK